MKALALALVVSGSAFAADVQALVITGATSEAAAAPLLEAAKKRAAVVAPLLTLAEGFPKVVDSATVKGLKPGFFIVLAGFCTVVDPALKALDPGAYAKPVQDVAEACPKVAQGWQASSTESTDAEKRKWRIVVFQPRGDEEWRAFLTVRDASGATLADGVLKQGEVSGCLYGGTASVSTSKTGVMSVKTTDCYRPRGCPNPGLATTLATFTLKGSEISSDVQVLKDVGMKGCSGE